MDEDNTVLVCSLLYSPETDEPVLLDASVTCGTKLLENFGGEFWEFRDETDCHL